ncbi:MAG: LPS export ABC transporter periplasmic protein LptC [Spirochaetes bacterium GWF1_31_7]|nr:MAG: LPS export ABC transporter periplasmic protein LptC [Spirochaetes bacterium GWE1_32_154]OHD48410.1 MAG: LPS export ABC transporter periplasmic protein LptC [Spirochaetes bacterium GWE2_31_10]OHD50886.1 MAG: LPS export ABC transporter periplasmic protein LptC [Spirochaetes bacterium GWF1_31_7]OHD83250.1 MAG: LPS export ABC transporter periplasmic protein LptC [Spirochaetes bacterium RIFOXYB1_FULL_32_8]HBD92725.1 LPS export ABC transporter periplasmic protein LptC [Spirochaetia bacterium]
MRYLKSIVCVIVSINILSCVSVKKKVAEVVVEYPDVVQTDYTHYIYKSGRLFLEAHIDTGKTFEKKKEIECVVISAKVYNSKAEITTLIKSDKGIINSNNSELIFSENVVIEKLDDKIKLETDSLALNYKNNTMDSKTKVLITKEDGSILIADSMQSDLTNQITTFTTMDLNYFYEDEEK